MHAVRQMLQWCAGFVWVDDQEINALAQAMKMDVESFENKFVRRVGVEKSLVEYPDGDCIFLEPTSRHCLVYDARPTQCRTWPFWNSNLDTPKDWQNAGKSCPGCDQGRVYSMARSNSAGRRRMFECPSVSLLWRGRAFSAGVSHGFLVVR